MVGVELQVNEAAHQLVVGIVPHPGIAIRLDGLCPFGHERHGLGAHPCIAGGAVEA